MLLKLNLASGTDIRDGWQNLDIVPKWPLAHRGCDVIWDARRDKIPFPDGSADEIYAGYLLLHLAPHHHRRVLADVRRVLARDGFLTVGEVDMEIVMPRYLADPRNPSYSDLIWGEQGNVHGEALADFDKHCQGFTESSLRALLSESGFGSFERIQMHCADVYYELSLRCRKS